MSEDYRPIDTAPRDGRLIEVFDEEVGAFIMRWNPAGENALAQPGPGIWETPGGRLTWSEYAGLGPRWWRERRGEP
jgi:hypothetical protein